MVRSYLVSLRPHQWVKNILVALPSLAAHRYDPMIIPAFAIMCAVASGIYVINDLSDIGADRLHPSKRHRPIASGKIAHPLPLAAALAGVAGLGAMFMPHGFAPAVGLYCLLAVAYSHWLKRVLMLDLVVLALLYGVRIWAGAEATHTPITGWLIAFSLFLFLSLAAMKRCTELVSTGQAFGRPYRSDDLPVLQCLGLASGLISALTLGLYVTSPNVTVLYRHPEVLWVLCLILTGWIGRVYLLAGRGKMHDDPVVFALTDRTSWLSGIAAAIVMFAAMW